MRPLLAALAIAASSAIPLQNPASPRGVRLSDLTWAEAETRLTEATVVVLPIAGAALEHGLHLKLGTDLALAEHLSRRVADAADVVVAPPLTYHRYPGLLEYPGSSSLSADTAQALTVDVVRSFAKYGPRRFYALVTDRSTGRALDPAAQTLAQEGILLAYTDIARRLERASAAVRKQAGGSHADEIETSMLLHIDPTSVDMRRAARDFSLTTGDLKLVRVPGRAGMYSPSGVWGDATLATAQKGRVIVDALVAGLLEDVDIVRRAELPIPLRNAPPPPAPSGAPQGSRGPQRIGLSGCSAGDERTILSIAEAYTTAWANADAETLASLWAPLGDIVHPDGRVERTPRVIRDNRVAAFMRREYRGSRYPLTLRNIRCINSDVAVVDGKWELRGTSDAAGKVLPTFDGLCTLVVSRFVRQDPPSVWLIEAFRYTVNPTSVPMPTWSTLPGIQMIK